jgi:DMSO reductase anchor subunit
MARASPERETMAHALSIFITLAALAVVIWAVVDVARRPALALAGKWKALWIAGLVGAWLLFGSIGALVSVFYLAGPRRRLNAVDDSGRHRSDSVTSRP